jgi:hypothetical protein
MNRIGPTFLILFAGWTLACHAATLLHASIMQACLLTPVTSVLLALCGKAISRRPRYDPSAPHADAMPSSHVSALIGTSLLLVTLYFSWLAFWAGSVFMLSWAAYTAHNSEGVNDSFAPTSRVSKAWIATLCIAAALLTLTVSRSDLDDAYYVAAAAFSAGHPHAPLLSADPMFGESGWPVLFPSYRFSAYEQLAGAIAHALDIPAMDIMYKWLPPLGAIAMVGAIFFCAREMLPQYWISAGTAAILLMLLLGEEHRGAANFGFVRAFQGKSLFLWIMVPSIYGLSFRYVSLRSRPFDLFLLTCAQLASIGLSNFAILCAPLAGAVAAISAAPPFSRTSIRRWLALTATTMVALPYLAFVAFHSHNGSGLSHIAFEPPSAVWIGIFGPHQQFLVAFLMLLAPFIANTPVLRWQLAIPPLILFAILLNPLLAPFISRYVTSPPVYWRVTWVFPALIYLGVAVMLLIDRVRESRRLISHATVALAITAPLAAMAVPGNTLRPTNHVEWRFASRKLEPDDSRVADTILALAGNGRILADDSISAILAMHESHPPLVNVRSMYLKLLSPYMPHSEYEDRAKLTQFVSGGSLPAMPAFNAELNRLGVGTLAIRADTVNYPTAQIALMSAGFHVAAQRGAYTIWTKTVGTTK